MEELTARIEKIEERNLRVEADKRWERSWLRRVSIGFLTYVVVCVFLFETGETNVFLKALVPAIGYILSTVSLRIIRKVSRY